MSNFKDSYEFETRLGHSGRDPMSWGGTVNPPVHHASTILSPDLETYISSSDYGRRGTLITRSVEEAAALIEGGDKAVSFPSGLAAISGALTPFLNAGDHLLIADNIYQPTRRFSTEVLSRFNIETEFVKSGDTAETHCKVFYF